MRYLTEGLPGTGGVLKATPEDFLVEELPAYLPQGAGEHTFLWIEKRGLNTHEAVQFLCRALDSPGGPNDAGTAGQKDRHAVTRQWVSLPRTDPEKARGLHLSGHAPPGGEPGTVTVLLAERHNNKLRTGHLRGNRFTVTLRGTEDGPARAQAILGRLFEIGLPNRYGAQRFGHGGRNEGDGRRWCAASCASATASAAAFWCPPINPPSSTATCKTRHDNGLIPTVLVGDILSKHESGGLFTAAEADVEDAQRRLTGGLLSVTGPIFGSRMRAPTEGTPPPPARPPSWPRRV